jgi:hypothetical protein
MPWKIKEPMDERVSLIADWKSDNYSITELCNAISFRNLNSSLVYFFIADFLRDKNYWYWICKR